MKIVVIGCGFVGLTHAAVLAESGHEVHACEADPAKLAAYRSGAPEAIERFVREPGLSSCIRDHLGVRLFFIDDPTAHLADAQAVFLCLPTPPAPSGATDLRCLLGAARDLAGAVARSARRGRLLVVTKSTVPVGTARHIEQIFADHGVDDVGVAANPEFLPQGGAIEATRRPDRVVVGADDQRDLALLRAIYSQLADHIRTRYIETTPETAEAIKYVSNALLLTYISFWNGVGARLAETFANVRMDDLKLGVTADSRISAWGSFVGNGAGGSCFGKDIRSLIHQLGHYGQFTGLLQAVYDINELQKVYLIDRAVHEVGFNFNNRTVAVLGLTFKKDTNDMRESAALSVVESLLARGVASVRAYDPMVDGEAARRWLDPAKNHLFARISYHPTAREALADTDALFISTDADEFRSLSPIIQDAVAPPYLIIDGRRMLPDYEALVLRGYDCLPVGGMAAGPRIASRLRELAGAA